jgi:replicative DNA helicase
MTSVLDHPRLPPQDLDAERAVLAAILLDQAGLAKVQTVLIETDFYRTGHQQIFRAMGTLAEQGDPIDHLTLTAALEEADVLKDVGGAAYLAELLQSVATAANVLHHAKLVREASVIRTLTRIGTDLAAKGYERTHTAGELLAEAETVLFQLAQGVTTNGFLPIKSGCLEMLDYLDRVKDKQGEVTGISTGFLDLDRLTAGWQPGDLILIAARPSMGKTSLALGSALAALKKNRTVGILSLEMPRPQLTMRLHSMIAEIDLHDLRRAKLTPLEWEQLARAITELETLPLWIDDSGWLSLSQLRAKARRLKLEHGLDLLIIDYLQLMDGSPDAESRQQEVAEISRSLKRLAKELNVPVLALSQLSRAVESRKPPIPMLADLRESGALEQDADLVLFIYREEIYNPATAANGIAEILIRKQRNGPIGDVKLAFHERFARFKDLALQAGDGG